MNTGLDPEVLVISGGEVVPASYFMPPPMENEHGRLNHLSYDNAAIEMRPAHASKAGRITRRLGSLIRDAFVETAKAKQREQIPSDSWIGLVPAGPLRSADRNLESIKTFGCASSFILTDDYSRRQVKPLVGAEDTEMRSAGFHIHQELPHPGTTQTAVAVMDGLLGLVDVIVNYQMGFTTAAHIRRQVLGYGRAGEFRSRADESGTTIVEYRTLSPWPSGSRSMTEWAIRAARAIASKPDSLLMRVLADFPSRKAITSAINNNEVGKAMILYEHCQEVWKCHTHGRSDAKRKSVHIGGLHVGTGVIIHLWGTRLRNGPTQLSPRLKPW